MNVLFLASTLPRFPNDLQAPFVLEQALAWIAARPDDTAVILAPHDAAAARYETIGPIEIERFRYFRPEGCQRLAYPAILPNIRRNPLLIGQVPFFLMAEYFSAKRLIRERQIDLVFAHWVMPQGITAHRLFSSLRVPYLLQNHSSDLSVFSKFGAPGRSKARTILRDSRVTFCVIKKQKDYAVGLFDEAKRSEIGKRINVLPMGVGLDVGPVRSSEASPGTADFPFQIGTISRLTKKKGVDLLILAAEKLASEGCWPAIRIGGDGEERAELAALLHASDVSFAGFVSGDAKQDFFNDVQFFAFTSVASDGDVEGMPVALLEALCCGKIVIASRDTNIAMLPEWDRIRHLVFYVENPRDIVSLAAALKELLQLSTETVRFRSAELRRIMARYLWPNLIEEYLRIIDAS